MWTTVGVCVGVAVIVACIDFLYRRPFDEIKDAIKQQTDVLRSIAEELKRANDMSREYHEEQELRRVYIDPNLTYVQTTFTGQERDNE